MPDYTSPDYFYFSSLSTSPWNSYGSSITTINIQNGVTTIGYGAFESCSSLTSITIGNSVTTIGEWAFYGCSNLRNVTVLRTSPPSITSGTTYDDTFSNVPLDSATLTVPKGCKASYQSAEGWKEFGTIVEMDDITH
jgi:hypothetical protein